MNRNMLKQAQKLQQRMLQAQESLEKEVVEAYSRTLLRLRRLDGRG